MNVDVGETVLMLYAMGKWCTSALILHKKVVFSLNLMEESSNQPKGENWKARSSETAWTLAPPSQQRV